MTFVDIELFGDRLHQGPGAAVVVLVSFLLSFLAIRTSARLTRSVSWWPGGVQSGGVHLHHLVWGIVLMMLCGFLAFSPLEAPWWHVVAVGFGVGAAVCFAKGRTVLGIVGLFIPVVAAVSAARLARPRSPWARWRYGDDKLSRSRARFADTRPLARAHRRLGDLVAGAPSEEP